MPIAKTSAPALVQTTAQPINQQEVPQGLSLSGVPIDVYSYFNVPLSNNNDREIGKLKDIVEWARRETNEGSIGDILQKIRSLETHLGSPSGTDRRYDKMYNYCKMSLHIQELEKRKEALRRVF